MSIWSRLSPTSLSWVSLWQTVRPLQGTLSCEHRAISVHVETTSRRGKLSAALPCDIAHSHSCFATLVPIQSIESKRRLVHSVAALCVKVADEDSSAFSKSHGWEMCCGSQVTPCAIVWRWLALLATLVCWPHRGCQQQGHKALLIALPFSEGWYFYGAPFSVGHFDSRGLHCDQTNPLFSCHVLLFACKSCSRSVVDDRQQSRSWCCSLEQFQLVNC